MTKLSHELIDAARVPSDGTDATDASEPLQQATLAVAQAMGLGDHLAKASELMQLLTTLYNNVFLSVLLYRHERNEVDAWVANTNAASEEGQPMQWSTVTHIEVFIRLLLHVPQLGAVTAALAAAATSSNLGRLRHAKEVQLDVSTKQLVSVTIVPLVEDFLCYTVARWEELFIEQPAALQGLL